MNINYSEEPLQQLNKFFSLITCDEEELNNILNKSRDTREPSVARETLDTVEHCCKCDCGKNLFNIDNTAADIAAADAAVSTALNTAANTIVKTVASTAAKNTTSTTNYKRYVYNTIMMCSMLFNSVCLAKLAFMN